MADMVFLTKLKPEPMGRYDASTAYGINSLVMSVDGASAYISVKDVPAGTPLTNEEYWKIHTDLSSLKRSSGGGGGIYVGPEEPSDPNVQIWIDDDDPGDYEKRLEAKADKAYMVALFEELKRLILSGDVGGAIAVLDQAILDNTILA